MTYIINPNQQAFDALRQRFEARFAQTRAALSSEIDHLYRSETTHIILPAPAIDDRAAYNMFTYCELELPVCPAPAPLFSSFDFDIDMFHEGA